MKTITALTLALAASAASANVTCMNYGDGFVSCSNGASARSIGNMTIIQPPRQEYDYGPFGTSMRPIQTPDMQVMPVVPVPQYQPVAPIYDMFWPK